MLRMPPADQQDTAVEQTASGGLTALQRYPVGQNPNWIEIVALP